MNVSSFLSCPVLSDPFSIADLEVGFWPGLNEGVLEGGFEVGDLEIGPEVVDVAAEGAGGTALGGGIPKPRSASESLPIWSDVRRGKGQTAKALPG